MRVNVREWPSGRAVAVGLDESDPEAIRECVAADPSRRVVTMPAPTEGRDTDVIVSSADGRLTGTRIVVPSA